MCAEVSSFFQIRWGDAEILEPYKTCQAMKYKRNTWNNKKNSNIYLAISHSYGDMLLSISSTFICCSKSLKHNKYDVKATNMIANKCILGILHVIRRILPTQDAVEERLEVLAQNEFHIMLSRELPEGLPQRHEPLRCIHGCGLNFFICIINTIV